MEKLIYFDHAATSYPKPQAVLSSVSDAMTEKGGNPGRSGHVLSVRAARAIFECREAVCSLFGTEDPERVIFTQNTTHSLNMAIRGLVKPGIHVLISNLEHNSVLRPLYALYRDPYYKITYSSFDATDPDDDALVFSFKRAIRQNTRLAVVTAASNVCGRILPINRISALCKSFGIKLVVDGAQAGGVFPFDFTLSGADILCLAGHKGLYGPQGTGIMICSGGVEPECFMYGGNGMNSQDLGMGEVMPERLEAGTLNTPGICGLCEGIKYVMKETPEAIFDRTLHLAKYTEERLLDIEGITVFGAYGVKAPVVLFNKDGSDPEEMSAYLSDRGICTRSGLHCAPLAHRALGSFPDGGVRISFGHLNTKKEADRFLLAVSRK